MRIITAEEIRAVLTPQAVTAAVRTALIRHYQGGSQCPPPMALLFSGQDGRLTGDCHVKAAASAAEPVFAVKVAAGFYDNPQRGLAVNTGAVLLFNSTTGAPEALIRDDGLLTAWRTAAAGVIAASLLPLDAGMTLGIIGTGEQAALQARWITALTPLRRVLIWGRNPQRAEALACRLRAGGLDAAPVADRTTLCRAARVVVTCTPAQQPVLRADHLSGPLHVVALGADGPGKSELDPAVLAGAAAIIADDPGQCLDHGDFGVAVRAGVVPADAAVPLGAVLAGERALPDGGLTVADLTGLGVQDLAIAALLWRRLA